MQKLIQRGDEMNSVIKTEELEDAILEIRGQRVLLDCDVASIYGVETKRINEAVRNNPDKFLRDYLFELDESEFEALRSKFSTTKFAKTRVTPKAFTEQGLYMLATILKGPMATQATIAIVETYSRFRDLSRNIKQLSDVSDKGQQKTLMQKSGELIAEILDDDLHTSDAETSIELNFAVLKFKHMIKKKRG
jgi:hypothetical protein